MIIKLLENINSFYYNTNKLRINKLMIHSTLVKSENKFRTDNSTETSLCMCP